MSLLQSVTCRELPPGEGMTLGKAVSYGQGQFPVSDGCGPAAGEWVHRP